jgi:hypothetical protein
MSESKDLSRRFLADFIAERLKAKQLEKVALRRAVPDPNPAASPRYDEGPACLPTTSQDSA